MQKDIKIGLEKLQFVCNNEFDKGLFLISEIEEYKNKPYIYFALQKAKKYQNIFAVYFRIFVDNRPPLPQIYLFDFTNENFDNQIFGKEIQKRVWNTTQVPLIYVFTKIDVYIFNSYSPELNKDEFSFYKKIQIAAEIDFEIKNENNQLIRDFSSGSFANGSFWDKEQYRKDFIVSRSVYEKLINKLSQIRKELIENPIIFSEKVGEKQRIDIIHRLLVMSILLKYLEEKTDEYNSSVFPIDFFHKYQEKANCFVDILRNNGNIIELFEDLSEHFNGEVFKLEEAEKKLISKINLQKFAEFFEGTTETDGQGSFWRLYSFDDLPVELISNIYENFLKDKKDKNKNKNEKTEKEESGIVYTPPFLVNFLLDELIPLTPKGFNTNLKILDPACGSGIFLVQAYKRLIQRWKIQNDWQKPDLFILKNLLLQNIYGVDIKLDAIRLTAFSLTLALCEELSPIEIWKKLKFDKLKGNLMIGDFFLQILNKTLPENFDIIVGNPPFIPDLTQSAQIIENKRIESGLPILPKHYSLSFLFLEQTANLLKESGNICLLFPSDSLLTRNSNFKKYFFRSFNIKSLIDFTPLRRILFKSASVAAVAIFYNKQIENQENILQIVVRRTHTSKSELFFELDKYDFHSVDKEESLKFPFIWKSYLFGISHRNFELVKKLDKQHKFSSFLNLKVNEGLLSKKQVNNPYLIIKKNIGKFYLKNQIVEKSLQIDKDFESESFKIYSNKSDTSILVDIKNKIDFSKSIYKFFILNTSDRTALSKSNATFLKEDFLNLPYIENLENILTKIEKLLIKDCNEYWNDFLGNGENSKILKKIKSSSELILFSEIYLEILNSVYETYKAAKPIINDNNIVFPFYWGDNSHIPTEDKLNETLQQLLLLEFPQANIRYIRIMRLYDENVIYLVKPNQVRYWLPSIAVRDADETFAYLVKQEYSV